MSYTKEATIIILDIGKHSERVDPVTSENFLNKEKSCCYKILQRRMFASKTDEVGIVVMGASDTDNQLHMSEGGYNNICELIPLALPNWNMIRNLEKHLRPTTITGDWLDALIVAMDMLRRECQAKKFGNLKIILFSTFSAEVDDEKFDEIIEGINEFGIQLLIINDNIEVAAVSSETLSQGTFSQREQKTKNETHNENLVKDMVSKTDAFLCNFEFALHHLVRFQRRKSRPTYWYADLELFGLKIQIASIISVKEEPHFKWKTVSANEGSSCRLVTEYYNKGSKINPEPEDLIKGYMLGSTPVAYDESLGVSTTKTEKGIKCMMFTHKRNILREYFTDSGTYVVLPKRGATASERMFSALVLAMDKTESVMIAKRVYNSGNKPKLVCLIPNMSQELPFLNMYEMFYAEQYLYWDFPRFTSKKTEPTAEQYAAIDKLMSAMDLMDVGETAAQKEAFPHNNLMNISLQYIYETVTARAINSRQPVPTLDGKLQEALKMPTKIKLNSAEIIKEVKELFPIEEVKKMDKRDLIRYLGDIPAQPEDNADALLAKDGPSDARTVVEVGSVTPAEDFLFLVERGENFASLARQIEGVIKDLLLKSMTDQNEKIAKAMMAYREEAKFFAPWEYNDWIRDFKNVILERKKANFWEAVVVKDKLGLIPISQSDLVQSITDEEAEEFYRIPVAAETETSEQESVDDLFNVM